ncbi:hypothetical protein DPMN_087708 [Dreissena polymorpha]|uniref:Uncharacterized protein n=1 Tax=Dreissena polymorpha TaxID=45954 RepID=A0A9D4QWE4_DREPO|nr:hypothetical protein DPMN_087708 [Dreissena polymorpha]
MNRIVIRRHPVPEYTAPRFNVSCERRVTISGLPRIRYSSRVLLASSRGYEIIRPKLYRPGTAGQRDHQNGGHTGRTWYAQRAGETVSGMKTTAGDLKRGHKGRAASCRPLVELRPDRISSLGLSNVSLATCGWDNNRYYIEAISFAMQLVQRYGIDCKAHSAVTEVRREDHF